MAKILDKKANKQQEAHKMKRQQRRNRVIRQGYELFVFAALVFLIYKAS